MATITKVSDITYENLAAYLRLDELDAAEVAMLNSLLEAAKGYVNQYTGRTAEEIDSFPEMVIVVYILVQDMWDNRTLYVSGTENSTVKTILDLHSTNLLPTDGDADA